MYHINQSTTEVDLIWFMVYLGMFTGVLTVGILIWGMYQDIKDRK